MSAIEFVDVVEAIKRIPECYLADKLYEYLVALGAVKWYKQEKRKKEQREKILPMIHLAIEDCNATITIPNLKPEHLIIHPNSCKILGGESKK